MSVSDERAQVYGATTPDNLRYPIDYEQPADVPEVVKVLADDVQAALITKVGPDHTHEHLHAEYSPTDHTHDTTHTHTGEYAPTAHEHDTTGLAPIDHTHEAVEHTHDYAAPDHTHDTSALAPADHTHPNSVLKIVAGANVTVTPDTGIGEVTISATGGGTGGGGGTVTEVKGAAPITVANGTTVPEVGVAVGTTAGTVAAGDHTHAGLAPTTRKINTTAPLMGGGDLSADRTLIIATGTIPGTVATGDHTHDYAAGDHTHNYAAGDHTHADAVPPTRKISTTAPLTGGGDLTADRTLGITTGTTAGTVATGDHSHPSVLTADQPQAVKVAGAVGTATTAARADHVHPGAVLLDPVSGAAQTVNGILTTKAPTGSSYLIVDTPNASTITGLNLRQGGKTRWILKKTSQAETGANAGSNLELGALADDGSTILSTPLYINRASGAVTLRDVSTPDSLQVSSPDATGGVLVATDAAGKTVGVYLRDSVQASTSNRWSIRKQSEAESGGATGSTGSNFSITRYRNDGTLLDSPIAISRATGIVTIKTALAARSLATSEAYAAHVTTSAETVVDDSGAETVVETEMLDITGVIAALSAEVAALSAEVAVLKGGA